MRYIIFILYIILRGIELHGQATGDNMQGKVSFVSSQNIYVKFQNTEGISEGDTLYLSSEGELIPALIVNNLSSVSCVCTAIYPSDYAVSQLIVARKRSAIPAQKREQTKDEEKKPSEQYITVDTVQKQNKSKERNQIVKGSISASSYSDFSNTPSSYSNRFRYNLSLDARNIGNSRFSTETYVSFRHKAGDWKAVQENIFNALKIYNLSVRFEPTSTTQISIGRRINPKIASIGAIDGLQVEQSIGKFALGAIVGSRPDYKNYGFNRELFQYGGYLAFNSAKNNTYSETSLAFMEQLNNSKTDRRFIYFQHSNSFIKNIYLFSTFELDLHTLKNDLPQNTFNLTGLYLSMRYKMTKNFSITGSYDSRKNVIYYETYKTLIDSILENEIRQSYRLQLNYRITKNLNLGLQSGYRFLKSDQHPSKNLYGYLSYNQIPWLKISATLSGTYLESNYMNGKVLAANISRYFFKGKLHTDLSYHYNEYSLYESLQSIIQNTGEIGISWLLPVKISFSAYYEHTLEKNDNYNRLYLQIRKRF